MRVQELDFELPEELIAQEPPEARDGARLAVVDRGTGELTHRTVLELPKLLPPSLFVVNDTKVIPARLHARKPTGGHIEFLLVERLGDPNGSGASPERWLSLARGTKSLRPGLVLDVDGALLTATIRALREGGEVEVDLALTKAAQGEPEMTVRKAIWKVGSIPLPPYIRRQPDESDGHRYQTVFANQEGSVAAPTAGLHFSTQLLEALGQAGHSIAKVTLHVGPGTFAPLRSDDLSEHRMHAEHFDVPVETALAIESARQSRRSVIAVGTTVCRTLESVVDEHGLVRAGRGSTNSTLR